MTITPLVPKGDDWTTLGLCSRPGMDPELWFADREDRRSIRMAKDICRQCPVAAKCLDYALAHETEDSTIHGVYGGTTAYQRRELLRTRTAARRTA